MANCKGHRQRSPPPPVNYNYMKYYIKCNKKWHVQTLFFVSKERSCDFKNVAFNKSSEFLFYFWGTWFWKSTFLGVWADYVTPLWDCLAKMGKMLIFKITILSKICSIWLTNIFLALKLFVQNHELYGPLTPLLRYYVTC